MDLTQYLERINYQGSREATLEVLQQLQLHHLMHVPFENFDIHLGRKIELDKTFDKVVTNRRGGFCYELNGLFYQLLESFGFNVKLVSARVYDKEKGFGPEFDHMAIITEVGQEKYLADVGFGEFALLPLKIELDITQPDQRGNFIIRKYDDDYLIVSKEENDQRVPQYIFSEVPRQPGDFSDMLHYHQTSSESHFTQKRLCSLPTENGRITITGNVLRIKEDGLITEMQLTDETAFHKALWDYFHIRL